LGVPGFGITTHVNPLTKEQVLSLAPDAASAKVGQQLAARSEWKSLGRNERAAWGEIQGSGKKPYQVRADLRDQATKCSCPSRKFPCKHALGLMLLMAEEAEASFTAPPDWVADWLEGREERGVRRRTAEAKPNGPVPDEAAAAKRAEAREQKVRAGLSELSLWMHDLVRSGLASAREQPSSFWESVAARMVDAQASGLARYVRLLRGAMFSGDGWQQRALHIVGRMHLLVEAYSRIDQLPIEVQTDLRTNLGWAPDKEEVAAREPIRDQWFVLGQVVEDEDRLRSRRTWLCGKHSRRPVMLLDYAPAQRPFESAPPAGSVIDAEVCFYPGAFPIRGLIRQIHSEPHRLHVDPAALSIDVALAQQARALAVNPWIEQWPMVLDQVTPMCEQLSVGVARWRVHDPGNASLPLHPKFEYGWELVSISGGRPMILFGEWDGEFLAPLSAMADGRFFALVSTGDSVRLRRIA